MNKTTTMLAIVAATALAACQSLPGPPFTPRAAVPFTCSTNTCELTLSITAGALDIDRDPMTIEKHNVKINWFAPAGYEFHKSDAILLKDPNADPNQQFNDKVVCNAQGNPLPHASKGICFQWHDKNTEKDNFPYEVRVYKADTNGPPLVLDPTIKNQG
jgi:hypothetical protein